ncbi:unnamed protein product [Natator depressus]
MVKDLIVHSPVLALFSPALPTIVTTDASDYGLGAVLTQLLEDNTERTVAFASRTLSNAERKYSTVEKEALASVWAIQKMENLPVGLHVQVAHRPQPFDVAHHERTGDTILLDGLQDYSLSIMNWNISLKTKMWSLIAFLACLCLHQLVHRRMRM